MSHSDGEILQIVIKDLEEVLSIDIGEDRLTEEQKRLIQMDISELKSLLSDWGPILRLFRFGNKYQR